MFFIIEMTDSRIQLMQNSLEETHVVGNVGKVIISNKPKEKQVVIEQNNFKNEDVFEECDPLD